MPDIKLIKVSEDEVELYGSAYVKRTTRKYAVTLKRTGRVLGYVESDYGLDYPGERSKVVIFWKPTDLDGNPLGVLGWTDYQKDAVQAVVNHRS